MTAKRYMGLAEIAALFNVTAATVSKWRTRYADTNHPTPEPTVWIGSTPGWDNGSDWKGWKETLPGRGVGGGPLPLVAARAELDQAMAEMEQAYPGHRHNGLRALHRTAERYGVDKDTIMAVWSRFADDQTLAADECDVRAVATIMRGRKRLTDA